MDLLTAVNSFVSGSEAHASLVTDRLHAFLWRYLATYVRDDSDREDVIAEVVARLWRRQGNLHFPTLGTFWAYTAKAARSVAMNRTRSTVQVEPFDEELAADDVAFVDTVADLSHERELLYVLADALWLGSTLDQTEARTRLLAAQFYYLHDRPVAEIANLLVGPDPAAGRRVSNWLTEDGVLLSLCFDRLYYGNDRLTAVLLDPDAQLDERQLDDIARANGARSCGQWTGLEVKLLLLRYRNGLLKEKILQLEPDLNPEQLLTLFDRFAKLLPFSSTAEQLKDLLLKHGVSSNLLTNPGLFKRLVFQYHASDELPQRQILERAGPVAQAAGYSLTEAMLNVWLSNGRLFTQLAAFAKEHG